MSVRIPCAGCGTYLSGFDGAGKPDPEICPCPVCELRSPVNPRTLWRDLCEQHLARARSRMASDAGLGPLSYVDVVNAMRQRTETAAV
jgi:hypothetical protein